MSRKKNLELWSEIVGAARTLREEYGMISDDLLDEIDTFAIAMAYRIVKILKKNPEMAETLRTGKGYTSKLDKAIEKFPYAVTKALKLPLDDMSRPLQAALMEFARNSARKSPSPESAFFGSVKKGVEGAIDFLDFVGRDFSGPSKKSAREEGDGPADGKMGRWVFSPNRIDGAPTDEPNTDFEEDLYRDISAYVTNNRHLDSDATSKIRDAMTGYDSIMHPPSPGTTMYRGMDVTVEWLRNALGEKFDELVAMTPTGEVKDEGSWMGRMVYTPIMGDTSSWSTDKMSAEGFTGGSHAEVEVVLEAEVEGNEGSFLDIYDLYGTKPMNKFQEEAEVMGMGPINVSKITWRRGRYIKIKK